MHLERGATKFGAFASIRRKNTGSSNFSIELRSAIDGPVLAVGCSAFGLSEFLEGRLLVLEQKPMLFSSSFSPGLVERSKADSRVL
jgi:hypothetical protein